MILTMTPRVPLMTDTAISLRTRAMMDLQPMVTMPMITYPTVRRAMTISFYPTMRRIMTKLRLTVRATATAARADIKV